MSIRFQADADLNLAIVLALTRKEPGLDFRTAFDAGFAGLRDDEVLAAAAKTDRVLVSHDRKTMPIHFAEFVQGGQSAGVVLVPQHMPVSDAAEWLLLIWATMEAEEWVESNFVPASVSQLAREAGPPTARHCRAAAVPRASSRA